MTFEIKFKTPVPGLPGFKRYGFVRLSSDLWEFLDDAPASRDYLSSAATDVAEALYQAMVAPVAEGSVIALRDGSRIENHGPDKWIVTNPNGPTRVQLADFEAHYLTDIAESLGTMALLAKATELEQRLRAANKAYELVRAQVIEQNEMLTQAAERLEANGKVIEETQTALSNWACERAELEGALGVWRRVAKYKWYFGFIWGGTVAAMAFALVLAVMGPK